MMRQDENLLLMSIYEKYGNMLKKLAVTKGVSPDDAEDIIQDSIVSFYLKYGCDRTEKEMRALLGRILINKCMDYHRRNSHYDNVSTDSDEYWLLTRHVLTDDALRDVVNTEKNQAVRDCILGMRKTWRDAVILHIVEGRSEPEAARILDISETACRARISRARKYLRESLGDWIRD